MNSGTGNGIDDFQSAAIAAFLRSSSEEIAPDASDEERIPTEVADSSGKGDGSQESAEEAAAIAFLKSSSEEGAPADSGEERVPTEVEADSLDVDLPQEWVHSSDKAAEIADLLGSSTEEALLPSPVSSRHNLDEPEPEDSPIAHAAAPGDAAAGDSPVSLESVECAQAGVRSHVAAEGSRSAPSLMELAAMLSEALVAQSGAKPPLHAGLPQPGAMPPPRPGAMQPVAPQMAQMAQMSQMSWGDRQVRRREH